MLTQHSERRGNRDGDRVCKCANGSFLLLWSSPKDSFPSLLPACVLADVTRCDGTVRPNWNESWQEKKCVISFDLCSIFFITVPPNREPSVPPFVFSASCPLTPSELATVLENAHANTHSFTYHFSHSHQPAYWFLPAFSHCLGRVKTGWLILPCPLFSSCTGGIHWDWCPSDHLCTAQELDVPGSVCGAQQLSVLSHPHLSPGWWASTTIFACRIHFISL